MALQPGELQAWRWAVVRVFHMYYNMAVGVTWGYTESLLVAGFFLSLVATNPIIGAPPSSKPNLQSLPPPWRGSHLSNNVTGFPDNQPPS
jgi:hypothetical protein